MQDTKPEEGSGMFAFRRLLGVRRAPRNIRSIAHSRHDATRLAVVTNPQKLREVVEQ
jgi:hypothetical protein